MPLNLWVALGSHHASSGLNPPHARRRGGRPVLPRVWPPQAVLRGDSQLPFPPASPPRENPAESPKLGLLPSSCLKLKTKNGGGQGAAPQSGIPPEEPLSGCVPLTGLRPFLSTWPLPASRAHPRCRGLGGRVRQCPDSQFPATPAPVPSSLQVAFRLDFEFSKSVFLHHLEVQLTAGRSGPGCSLSLLHTCSAPPRTASPAKPCP